MPFLWYSLLQKNVHISEKKLLIPWNHYLEQSKEIKQNCAEPENFKTCLFVNFNCSETFE